MRVLGVCGLVLSLVGTAVAQDTSVIIRSTGRSGAASSDTTITIRRTGQADQVIHLNPQLNRELRANLQRQLAESHLNLAKMRESSKEMQARTHALARRSAQMSKQLAEVNIERQGMKLDTLQLREMNRMAETMARQSSDLVERTMEVFTTRPRLGITVDINPRESDKYGAYVSAVTPGGAAAKAGIHAGDIITRIGGKSLTAPDSIRRESDQSVPGLRLIEMAAQLEAGKTVEVEFRRGTETRKLSLVPTDEEGLAYYVEGMPLAGSINSTARPGGRSGANTFSGRIFSAPRGAGAEMPEEPRRVFDNFAAMAGGNLAFTTAFGGPLADLELAPLNEKLGAYFGVTEGVLVIDVPEKDNLGLIPGDVITAVDGRKVTNPNQLMRVLRTYDKNEEFKLQITRQKRGETVTTKLP